MITNVRSITTIHGKDYDEFREMYRKGMTTDEVCAIYAYDKTPERESQGLEYAEATDYVGRMYYAREGNETDTLSIYLVYEHDLKKCPFCGGEAKVHAYAKDLYQVTCINCHAKSASFFEEEDAIKAWNKRE